MKKTILFFLVLILLSSCSQKQSLSAILQPFDESSELIGFVKIENTALGTHVIVESEGLSPGIHTFHIHENPSCDDLGQAAGGHYDPMHTEEMTGSYHGELPVLHVDESGNINLRAKLENKLSLSKIKSLAIVLHESKDHPENPGSRIACGVLE